MRHLVGTEPGEPVPVFIKILTNYEIEASYRTSTRKTPARNTTRHRKAGLGAVSDENPILDLKLMFPASAGYPQEYRSY